MQALAICIILSSVCLTPNGWQPFTKKNYRFKDLQLSVVASRWLQTFYMNPDFICLRVCLRMRGQGYKVILLCTCYTVPCNYYTPRLQRYPRDEFMSVSV